MSDEALVALATGRYSHFVPQLVESVEEHLPNAEVFVLSDSCPQSSIGSRVTWLPWGHTQWPFSTLIRHRAIAAYSDLFSEFESLIHLDVDMRFVAPAMFPKNGIFAVEHPGYVGMEPASLPYERRPESCAAMSFEEGTMYFAGGLQGGETSAYLDACRILSRWMTEDLRQGIIPKWHDESLWNRFCYLRPPDNVLSADYCQPEKDRSVNSVVLALDKEHAFYRNHRRFKRKPFTTSVLLERSKGIARRTFSSRKGS